MEESKKPKAEKVTIKLTDDQKKQLSNTFGEDLTARLEHIEIEQLAGYLKANAAIN